ncbi:DUF998 domain-containing protein [Solirubrobacter sp. CPCC 204708]|uniref:DUF998 domain-containing protein n=1 Tax=Solirubrobacter deserti TaxID=2282478 RepID=A0ABT4REW8_9ACTN|nr:DUF998 domain-containing protein [Solirubrobacter deserti]MBE2318617.1 DUF998 domain-containing protein [Solirubrobacter deserti]MDA0137075.1 DUF998 domain-containing protein [Solirubrobacter deserti]
MRRIVLGGIAAFVGLVALEHLLRTDLPPGEHFVSEYAVGWTRPVQTVAFLAWAAATAACALLAARVPWRPIARGLVVLMLVAATAGLLVAAVWTTETVGGQLPSDVQRTLGGRLHDLGTLGILAGLLLAALTSLRLIANTRYRLTVLALGVALVAIVPALIALRLDAPGIGQRGFILVGLAWQLAFASRAEQMGSA